MNNGLKALLIAASTVITCIIVSLGFSLAREAKQLGNHVVEELYHYRSAIEERDFMRYDGVIVYGADVTNLMKRELSEEKNGFRVTIREDGKSYSYETLSAAEKAFVLGSDAYILPVSEYVGSVKKNENEVIVEIVFTKK